MTGDAFILDLKPKNKYWVGDPIQNHFSAETIPICWTLNIQHCVKLRDLPHNVLNENVAF